MSQLSQTVLVVEDDEAQSRAIERALGRRFAVKTAATLAAARARLDDENFIAAIIDVGLPDAGEGGLELLRWLRARYPTVGALVVSARFERELLEAAAELGAFFLAKPLSMTVVERWLENTPTTRREVMLAAAREDYGLSAREFELLRWLVHGGTVDAFARHVGVGEGTAKAYARRLATKLGVPRVRDVVGRFRI